MNDKWDGEDVSCMITGEFVTFKPILL